MNRKLRAFAIFAALIIAGGSAGLYAYNPPAGGILIPLLGSPDSSISGLTVTALDSPWADRLNPAASAVQQRHILALGFEALTDFGSQGFGAALALGYSRPEAWGVFGAGLRLVSTPASMTSLPLGSSVISSASVSKALFPEFFVGAGLDLSLGGNGGFGWGLDLDLGFIHFLGDQGPFLDLRWGGTFSNIGKGYSTPSPATGSISSSKSGSYTPPFTPTVGAEALFIRNRDWKIGASAQVSLPSFQDFSLSLQADAVYRDFLSVRSSWGFGIRELIAGSGRSLIPSLSFSATIPIEVSDPASFLYKNGWKRSEIDPNLVFRPLYGGVWGIGASAVLALGSIDSIPPIIDVRFPSSEWGPPYISPNSDGLKDSLSFGVSITDGRYLESYAFHVYRGDLASEPEDAAGLVRSVANKEQRPETSDFTGLWQRLTYVQKGLKSPGELLWGRPRRQRRHGERRRIQHLRRGPRRQWQSRPQGPLQGHRRLDPALGFHRRDRRLPSVQPRWGWQ